jgi:hypothetical protein
MGLAGPALAYKDDRLRLGQIVAAGKFVDLLSGDRGALAEVELMLIST